MKKKKQKVRVERLNWDAEYYSDIINGRGFTITEPAEISLDGTKKKAMYGAQSPLYGTTYGDDQAFIERYRCPNTANLAPKRLRHLRPANRQIKI
jgi:hypothetical protein